MFSFGIFIRNCYFYSSVLLIVEIKFQYIKLEVSAQTKVWFDWICELGRYNTDFVDHDKLLQEVRNDKETILQVSKIRANLENEHNQIILHNLDFRLMSDSADLLTALYGKQMFLMNIFGKLCLNSFLMESLLKIVGHISYTMSWSCVHFLA